MDWTRKVGGQDFDVGFFDDEGEIEIEIVTNISEGYNFLQNRGNDNIKGAELLDNLTQLGRQLRGRRRAREIRREINDEERKEREKQQAIEERKKKRKKQTKKGG